MKTDEIPIIAEHRGVGLHDNQDPDRLAVVRRDIDQVFDLAGDAIALFSWAEDRSKSPESRLLAAALIRAQFEIAAEKRNPRPPVDLEVLDAMVTGLDSARWRSPTHFDTVLAPRFSKGDACAPVKRPRPLAG